jgi:hypothetical protein
LFLSFFDLAAARSLLILRSEQEITMLTQSLAQTQLETLCTRITCEYLEMPNLAVTLPQAIHLWNADPESCARVLDRLVASGFLRRAGCTYRRNDAGYRAA